MAGETLSGLLYPRPPPFLPAQSHTFLLMCVHFQTPSKFPTLEPWATKAKLLPSTLTLSPSLPRKGLSEPGPA